MARKLKTAPSEEPISLDEAKEHLRVTESDEDVLIRSLIAAAREYCEVFTERAFVTQSWELFLDCFPNVIEFPRPPLQSITSIKYIDTDGVEQTLDSSVYTVDSDSTPGRVYLAYNQSWPSIRSQRHAVTVEFVAGYGAAETVPDAIKAAIKLMLGHLYENREAVVAGLSVNELPLALRSLLTSQAAYEAA